MSEPDAHGWLPIETAPDVGTFWFALDIGERLPLVRIGWRDIKNPGQTGWVIREHTATGFWTSVTHWQPILPPEPPVPQSSRPAPNEPETTEPLVTLSGSTPETGHGGGAFVSGPNSGGAL